MTTSEPNEIVLEGCAPVPLAGYLKALGVFRLIANQVDAEVRSFWRNERFVLRTRLAQDELIRVFLNEYRPTPVISPWNGGSGFYFRERKTKEKDPSTGKRIKTGIRDEATTATRTLDALLESSSARFDTYRQLVREARKILESHKLEEAPDESAKADLILELRSVLKDEALDWIDAAAVVTINGDARQLDIAFPPLLGSGGNDGNLDFSSTLLQTLFSLFDSRTGEPLPSVEASIRSALFGTPSKIENRIAISQYAPGAISSPNLGAGFTGSSTGNPWDVVLGLEGTLVLSAAAVRRIGMGGRGEASFPFMISRRGAFGAGAGSVDVFDEQTARGEFWAPMWDRPIAYGELLALFREGRAVVERKSARNALDFARAVGQLGVDRGINYFERYAFEQRFGNMYLGVPLARHDVPRSTHPDLIADLARGGWLDRVRSALRGKNAAASLIELARRFDDLLFRLAADCSPETVQEALIAIGKVACEVGRRTKSRDSVPPPRRLSQFWIAAAEDGSHEFALAAALASIDATAIEKESSFALPFRRHLATLNVRRNAGGWDDDFWDDSTASRVLAVWTGRSVIRDMVSTLERRVMEAQRRNFTSPHRGYQFGELPLRGLRIAPLASVAAFLAGRTDDSRISALAVGLAWAHIPAKPSSVHEREDALPLAYGALKPLFDPEGVGPSGEKRKAVDPLPIVRLLRAGRTQAAVTSAQQAVRGSGLPTPFAGLHSDGISDVARLTASLLFPIAPMAYERLIARTYPGLNMAQEKSNDA